jgi:predicted ATPase/class 3 adenylate cyclase
MRAGREVGPQSLCRPAPRRDPSVVRNLPAGTVTFLFTDVEGSTRLLHELGDSYADVLTEHRRLLRQAFAANGGVEVDTQGDAFFVAFGRASDALTAAGEARAALEPGPIRVRMGLHTGEPLVTDEGYIGMDVHRAARIAAAGDGGQILVSQSTRELAGSEGLRDLGEHRFKDLLAPERIYQLGDGDFAPLKSLNTTNLPVASNPLVGRGRELAEIQTMLRDGSRLVTLIGPGGSGKTRLALQVAAELVDDFSGGVFFVPLAGVNRPDLVSATIAGAVGVRDANELGDRESLLLIDNFEHLLDAAPAVTEILVSAPRARILATSRSPLRLDAEKEFALDPLPSGDALELLTERARAVRAGFEPDEAAREICARLDGLPLALELAASRLRSLGAGALLERLDRRLPVLTGGRRDAPERQRTLRATIEWSYDLLPVDLKGVFARLAVFAGTFSLPAVEAVVSAEYDDVDALVEASLLKAIGDDRFLILETIREFALERLDESGYGDDVRLRHAEHLVALARSANLHTEDEGPMRHELLTPERDNIRTALDWTIETDRKELGLRLAVALENWWITTDASESVRWFERLLALPDDIPAALLAGAMRSLGNAATVLDDPAGEHFFAESLELARTAGDERFVASVLHRLALSAVMNGDEDRGLALMAESDDLAARLELLKVQASNLSLRAEILRQAGVLEEALALHDKSRDLAKRSGFTWWEKIELILMSLTLFSLGRPEEAGRNARQAVALARRMNDRPGLVDALAVVARSSAESGDLERAGRIWGAIEAEVERAPVAGWGSDHDRLAVPVLAFAGPVFDAGREAGRATPFNAMVAEAERSVD